MEKATLEQLKEFNVSASGYGIHWDKIDEDISIPALLNEPIPNMKAHSLSSSSQSFYQASSKMPLLNK